MEERKQITIYTDGGCDPNPGPGGYGVVLLFGAHRKELSGGFRLTTNNRMEILAVIKGLEALKEPCQVTVYSDSKYLVDAIQQGWAKRWRERNWMRNSKDAAINPDLWERLLTLCETHQVKFAWLKGHAGIPENERCDQLSTQALHQPDLPADEGYENRPEDTSPGKVTDIASCLNLVKNTGWNTTCSVHSVGRPIHLRMRRSRLSRRPACFDQGNS